MDEMDGMDAMDNKESWCGPSICAPNFARRGDRALQMRRYSGSHEHKKEDVEKR